MTAAEQPRMRRLKESAKKGLLEEKLEPNAEHKRSRVRPVYKAPVACHIDSYYVLKYLEVLRLSLPVSGRYR